MLHTKFPSGLLLAMLPLIMVSCGSYQQASYYDNDGIYAEEQPRVTAERYPQSQRRVVTENRKSDNVYSNYFGQKADEYEQILEGEIFTDVDSYTGTAQDSLALEGNEDYYYDPNNTYQGYAGWGDNATSVTVNVYDNWGWGGFGFGLGYPWLYGSAWGWGYPYGYGGYWGWNRWGWNNWGWGWNNWGWGYPYGYAGYWGGYYGYPYYGYGYYGYPYRYGRGYYGYGAYGYNRSRRGIYGDALANNNFRGRSNLNSRISGAENSRYRTNSGRSNINTTRSSNDRSSANYRTNSTTRRSVGVDAMERNRAYRSSRATRALPRYNSQGRSSQPYGNDATRSNTYSRRNSTAPSTNRGTYSRTSPSRSSGYSRSAPAPGRNSGYRSSGSSSRSSGYSQGRSSSPSRSSGYRSSGGSSRSSGGAIRSSGGGSSRSSGVRSSGGGRRSP